MGVYNGEPKVMIKIKEKEENLRRLDNTWGDSPALLIPFPWT